MDDVLRLAIRGKNFATTLQTRGLLAIRGKNFATTLQMRGLLWYPKRYLLYRIHFDLVKVLILSWCNQPCLLSGVEKWTLLVFIDRKTKMMHKLNFKLILWPKPQGIVQKVISKSARRDIVQRGWLSNSSVWDVIFNCDKFEMWYLTTYHQKEEH